MSLSIQSPAKINLWLEVLRKRADGYHDLSTLMLPIAVFDDIEVELLSGGGIRLSCDHPQVPSDAGNLAWKAADRFFRAAQSGKGAWIHLKKRIPVAAGLGGGSGDAASVLKALNRLHGEPLGFERLHDLAVELGADVPFFLAAKPAIATGIGDVLHEVQGVPEYPIVLVTPPLKVSTAWVYQSLALTRGASSITLQHFLDQPWQLAHVMQNDLEHVTLQEFPGLEAIKRWLLDEGASGVLMSGSGPTVFGVFPEGDHAARVSERARHKWSECWVRATRTLGSPVPCEAPQGGSGIHGAG